MRQNGYKSDGLRYSGSNSYQPKAIQDGLDLWMIQCSHIQFSGVYIHSLKIGVENFGLRPKGGTWAGNFKKGLQNQKRGGG